MTDTAVFAAARDTIFAAIGASGWLTTRANVDTAVKVMLGVPDRDEMVGDAPMSLSPNHRWVDLQNGSGAGTGDLVTVDGETWILSRSVDLDSLGLTSRWIGVPFGEVPALSFSYHASGYPLVTWNGAAWVAP